MNNVINYYLSLVAAYIAAVPMTYEIVSVSVA
jgi:hypothetical protein